MTTPAAPFDVPEEAVEAAAEALMGWCPNCDGRKCMDCVFRNMHEKCEDSCPDCCEPERVTNHSAWHRRVGGMAEDAIEAALPSIEAALRERIAGEIEAAHRDAPRCDYDVAARIVRGGGAS